MPSQLQLFNNSALRERYLEEIRRKAITSLGLPIVPGELTTKPEPVIIILPDSVTRGKADDQQTRDSLANDLIKGLEDYASSHSITELREEGVMVEAQRIGLGWHLVGSVRY